MTSHNMDSSTKSPPLIGHVFFSGLNEPCSVGSIVEVVVNTQSGDDSTAPGNVQVYATSPIGLKQPCDIIRHEKSFTTTFTPDRIGKWLVSILYEGQHIHGSPFTCYVFDASMVRVSGLDVGFVGKELKFTVDATRAGQGEMKIEIFVSGQLLPVIMREEPHGSGIYRVRFTPPGPGNYEIKVNFNNQPVKGSPFILDIADSSSVSVYGEQLQMTTVDQLTSFFIHASGIESRDVTCIITNPSGKKKYIRVIPLDETTFKAEWKPIETGEHLIDVLIFDRPSSEGSFTCQVGDPDQVVVRRMPHQIEARNLNKKHTFEIDATAAGSGNLEIVINGGRVACHVRETTSRHFLAEFMPVQEVKHNIEMRFNGKHVCGSPWIIPFVSVESKSPTAARLSGYDFRKRADELTPYDEQEDIITELIGLGLNRAAIGIPTHFDIRSNTRLGVNNISIRILNVENGRSVENIRLIERALGTVCCEYIVPIVGDYEVIVNINGRRVDTEPLIVSAFDPHAVRIWLKDDGTDYRPGKPAQFTVDAAEAGKGQLEISVNQGQVPNNVQMQDAGRCLVTFIPQHAGTYVIDVTFNGLQVHGCPIKVDVRERQVGKPVSAPVYPRPTEATAYGTSPTGRGPSSAYYSSTSPRLLDATTMSASSYAPSPSSPPNLRSPPLVSSISGVTGSELRSPALVRQQQPKGLLGYTVAQYGSKEQIFEKTTTTQVATTTASLPEEEAIESQRQHRYFGEPTQVTPVVTPITPPSHRPPIVPAQPFEAESAQFEMTRSAELTLFRERPAQANFLAAQPTMASSSVTTTTATMEDRREIPIQHIYDHVPEEREHIDVGFKSSKATHGTRIATELPVTQTYKQHDLPYAPLDSKIRQTLEILRAMEVGGPELEITTGRIGVEPIAAVGAPTTAVITSPSGATIPQIQTHIVEPYSSDIETAMTPGTRRRLLEHTVYKAADLTESEARSAETDHEGSEPPTSRPSSKATTPRLSLKFRGSKEKKAALVPGESDFDWGKSKINSKHEVVRRGKDVEVRIEGLKLGKDDQLRVVVLPPQIGRQQQPVDQPAQQPPELPSKLKKTGTKSWEISFRPTEVGTHKLLAFVNNIPHPQTPFPIRVYDAAQIAVGDIVRESTINDTVEFTVDAGRAGFGNLEMAIKDHDGIIIPSHVSQLEAGAAKFLVTFTPNSAGTHTVHITFNKEMVKGSPFEVHIVEPPVIGPDGSPLPGKKKKDKKSKKEQNGTHSKSSSRETGSSMAGGTVAARPMVSKLPSLSRVDRPVELLVTLARMDDLVQAQVHDLNRELLPLEIITEGSNVRKIVFQPKRVGDHEVDIRVGGVEIDGSPFTCRVYDPTKIMVGHIPNGTVDRPVSFVVDASQAGVGNLEVAVNDGKIPSMAHALGQHKYEITFVPKEQIDHEISVRFNNEPVPGSPFVCRLVPAEQLAAVPAAPQPTVATTTQSAHSLFTASGIGLERISVGQVAEFFVDSNLPDQPNVAELLPKVQITDPRGELLPVDVAAYNDEPTRAVVKYTPRSVGNHQISIKCNGQPIVGSPFTAKAFDANCVKLALDADSGQVRRACTFTIDAAKAGAGNMEIIVSVGKKNVPNYVQPEGPARFRVSFTPQQAQEHLISVKFNGVSVPGSPLRTSIMPAPPRSPRPSRGEIIQTGEQIPFTAQPTSSTIQQQQQLQPISPAIAREGKEEEEEQLRLVGDLASAQLGQPKRFSIDAPPGQGYVECNVVVVGPDRSRTIVNKQQVDGHSFDIAFTPTQIGDYHIDIQLNGKSLAICPIKCRCLDSTSSSGKIFKRGRTGPTCGKDYMFVVELPKRTRKEHLLPELRSVDTGQHIPVNLDIHPNGERALCSFRALQKPQQYQFTLYRDGNILDERVLEAINAPELNEPVELVEFADPILVEHLAIFELLCTGESQHLLDEDGFPMVQIFDASGRELPVHLLPFDEQGQQRIRAEWQPQTEGRHRVFIKSANNSEQHFCGSPLPVNVLDLSAVRVVGLYNDVVGAEQTFTIDWSDSGGQSAKTVIQHESGETVKCSMKRLKRGIHSVTFTPRLPGLHLLTIFIDGMELPECPYECMISDRGSSRARGDALKRAQRGKTARFEVSPGTSTPPQAELDVIVTNSQGSPLPVRCYKQQDESYWVEFTPEICGRHSIEVTFGDQSIHGSPFHCEVVDPRQVCVQGIDRPFSLRTIAHLDIKRNAAGTGALVADLVDPQGESVKMDKIKNAAGDDSFTFLPIKLGVHKLHVKLAGFTISGSPFSLVVEEQRVPAVYGAALDYAIERGQQASMIFDANKQPGGLKIEVRSPTGERIRHTTNRRPDECTEIAFRPQEVGYHEVHIDFNNRSVHGSPFRVTVVDPTKVVVNDRNFRSDGMLQLVMNQRNLIDVDATAAGPVKLRAEIRDADGELLTGEGKQVDVHSLGYGKFQLEYTPRHAAKYKIYVYCSELVVPGAYPLLAITESAKTITAPMDVVVDGVHAPREPSVDMDLSKLILRGDGLTNARIREQAEFILDASELKSEIMGKCTATLHGERADVPVKLSALRNQVFKGVYTPLVAGTYQLSVLIDGKHVHGSPSMVNVESSLHPAELIEVDGRPLKMGIIGEDVRTVIDARRAGPGQISAQCIGPTQAEYCELLDNRDGTYLLRVQPKELGKHTLSIRYENEHVRDSPFIFNVNNPPDPSKVKVHGPGIEHGILHSFKSDFVVDTKGAGAGQLTVRVRGPKGAFNVEMQRDREQERTIHCKYEPREPGDYQVEVKWHGQHVPGSPFFVLIVDTEQELQRFLAGGAPSPTPPSPFVPPGWLPPGPPGLIPGGPHPSALPIMPSPMPPPHLARAIGGRVTPSSASAMVVPMPHPPPSQHYTIGPPAMVPHFQQQPIYGKHQ